ncbi:hypothetical protein AVEN_272578-1 [Araneus ventricosus]|uniref:Uncharacterized protein n=1 Tax=Araneus ventricosus TaxID=182803 RepID=A0A4Y2WKE1_ARAVE|nr:hypothetical protein AVEN_272578-1 [Araneus ventricosus]
MKLVLVDQHYPLNTARRLTAYLLAQRIELQRRSHSKVIPVDQHSPRHPSSLLIYFPTAGREVTWNHLVHSSVSLLLIEISRRFQHLWDPIYPVFRRQTHQIYRQVAKMIAKFVAKVRGPDVAAASHPILIPVKLSSQP